jgi:hypothetical protein
MCQLCRARKAALTPAAIQGRHDGLGALPEAAGDVTHRVVKEVRETLHLERFAAAKDS